MNSYSNEMELNVHSVCHFKLKNEPSVAAEIDERCDNCVEEVCASKVESVLINCLTQLK